MSTVSFSGCLIAHRGELEAVVEKGKDAKIELDQLDSAIAMPSETIQVWYVTINYIDKKTVHTFKGKFCSIRERVDSILRINNSSMVIRVSIVPPESHRIITVE